MNNSVEYILCAALRRNAPRPKPSDGSPYWEGTNDIMDIEIGYRHHDILVRFGKEVSHRMFDQGFYTSKGRFVGRCEAMKIAYEAGQVAERRAFRTPPDPSLDQMFINIIDTGERNTEIEEDLGKTYNELFSEDLY